MRVFNRAELKDNRKLLRQNSTKAENGMWSLLRNSNLLGRKFRRQHGIGNYIVDFYCASEKLVIELDGAHHFTLAGNESDSERDKYLESLGLRVLRFENSEFIQRPDAVLYHIIKSFSGTTFEKSEDNINRVVDLIIDSWGKK